MAKGINEEEVLLKLSRLKTSDYGYEDKRLRLLSELEEAKKKDKRHKEQMKILEKKTDFYKKAHKKLERGW